MFAVVICAHREGTGMSRDDEMTPLEAGHELYNLLKYGPKSSRTPVRRTETRRITRRLPNGEIEILEQEFTYEGYED